MARLSRSPRARGDRSLREIFVTFSGDRIAAKLDEYSEAPAISPRIIDLSGASAAPHSRRHLVHMR